jgi:hypothetical protein
VVASPNLTLTITPPGGSPTNYTSKLAWSGANQQMQITQNFGRQGDTATIPLIDDYTTVPNFHIPVMSQVSLYDNTAGLSLFAGVVNDPTQTVVSVTQNEWDLNCTDYTYFADNAIVQGTFNGWTVDQIVVALTAQANCGISAATVHNGGYVAPGPQLASFVCNYKSLSDAWRTLAQLAGQVTPYGWYVDENRHLHFYDSTTALSSGVTFTTTPTAAGAGSLTEAHFALDSQFSFEWDGTTIHNRILVQGANQTIYAGSPSKVAATDTWLGDGAQTSWGLRYIVSGTPTVYVGGVQQTVTVVAAGGTGSTAWQVQQNAAGGYFLTNTVAAPAAGVKIQAWYDYQVPIVMQASDFASQAEYTGPNGGVFAEYINDSTLVTPEMALARAQRERTEYAYAVERLSWDTTEEWLGWARAGQTCQAINSFLWDDEANAWGVNDTFLIIANSVTFGRGGYRTCQLTAVRL